VPNQETCSEKARLSDVFVKAVEHTFRTKTAYEKLAGPSAEATELAAMLAAARKRQLNAAAELRAHRQVHGC
jgi:hypothetical protein